jgi:site-specific DNA-methyltransferase (adenine-specific)
MIDLRLGDCLEILRTLPDNSVDSIVTDPPYHLTSITKRFGKEGSAPAQYGTDGAFARASKGFMGKEWDGGDIAFRTDVWSECLRVLKPGGHLLSFGGSRTYHRMAVAIEDAGFEVRDQIMWVYGSGFPKSHNIGKAIDKIEGNEREVVGDNPNHRTTSGLLELGFQDGKESSTITKGNSDYEGWGTALKPAHEPICMARKPLSEKSIAENVLKWGTGGINIDGSRIGSEMISSGKSKVVGGGQLNGENTRVDIEETFSEGRFPANIIFDEEAGKLLDEQSGIKEYNKGRKEGNYKGGHRKEYVGTIDNDIDKKVEGQFFSDKGGASRFFYCPKVSKKERGDGNVHPTVKPLKLLEYLIKLVTPKGGVVMDCFMGSGSTGIAANNLGFRFLGIEKEQEYFDIAKQRILP